MLRIRGLLRNGRRGIGGVVHGRRHLGWWLSVNGSSMLVMLWGLDRGWGVGLGRMIDWGVARAIHGGGRHQFRCFCGRLLVWVLCWSTAACVM